ncbi:hypothetical protein F3Y22_tig00001293pilonHSYRG00011 [Hibiscus syriacus]|uniref:Protein transport protein SEC23 n=1 Tax=Hibiscus syriacus TaxID=106335 RepID=A0A6A3CYD6_HIBSY|nr:hypothetical protein F3Y22_tig00001293pilonHSYRG00011 [Hibiscus syriacus]
MARLVSFKMETEAEFDPIRWLDKALIHICSRFGDYQKDAPSSFSLSPRFSLFPQLVFHLRRSQFFQSAPEPALLDVSAVAADRILLLDSYFTVVIFHGSTIAQWRKAGYHSKPAHQAFAELLQAPCDDADAIIKERFPVPRLVVCDQYGSQARFLLAKLNPSATYNSDGPRPGGDIIFTDDISLEDLGIAAENQISDRFKLVRLPVPVREFDGIEFAICESQVSQPLQTWTGSILIAYYSQAPNAAMRSTKKGQRSR